MMMMASSGMRRVLNLGAGLDRSEPGAVTVDRRPLTSPDILHDLDLYPWPIESNSFDVIVARDVIEHLADIVRAMEEIHRIGRPGARVHITTPHFSCANSFTDPTHRFHLGYFSFDYFTGANQWGFYTRARFRMVDRRIRFYGRYKNFHIAWLANRYPRFYEEHLCWIFPAWYLVFDLQVVK
jgi:SAM-dependent methyltransferase